MYKVFTAKGVPTSGKNKGEIVDGFEIFWCPTEHEKHPINNPKFYEHRQAAYRRAKHLNDVEKAKATKVVA